MILSDALLEIIDYLIYDPEAKEFKGFKPNTPQHIIDTYNEIEKGYQENIKKGKPGFCLDRNKKGYGEQDPDLKEIQCSKCKHKKTIFFIGHEFDIPNDAKCKKYKRKPDGIISPICKDQNAQGVYIKCDHFEPIEKIND